MGGANHTLKLGVGALLAMGCAVGALSAPAPAQAPAHTGTVTPAPHRTAVALPLATGELFGLVTDAAGHPQAQAVVEVRGDGFHSTVAHLLTTASGVFTLAGLPAGVYYVEVGKGARVAERRQVVVHASERALLLVNLPQVLRAMQLGPPAGAKGDPGFDWALRQATAWKPILRLDDSPATGEAAPDAVQGYVALTAGAGSSAFAGPDLATAFRVDTRILDDSEVSFTGTVGTNSQGGGGDTRVQAAFSSTAPANHQRMTLGVRQLAIAGAPGLPALRTVSLSYANEIELGDRLSLQYGGLANAVSMSNTVAAFSPYLRAIYRLGDQSQVEYRAASAVPPLRFLHDQADLPDPTPQVTLVGGRAQLERARHQELLYSDSLTPNDTLSAAVFDEHFRGTAINGADADSMQAGSGNLLPDLLNNMFVANGGDYGGWGYRVSYGRRLSQNWRADLGFSSGAALVATADHFDADLSAALSAARAHAWTAKLSGVTPITHTRLVCSYRALNRPTVTGLDLYDDGAAQSDSYANIDLRQPLPGRIEALVEIHNLLAQGYVPMMGSDGHTLYLVQSARSLRGGFTFSF